MSFAAMRAYDSLDVDGAVLEVSFIVAMNRQASMRAFWT
jgi:hypothetical protein